MRAEGFKFGRKRGASAPSLLDLPSPSPLWIHGSRSEAPLRSVASLSYSGRAGPGEMGRCSGLVFTDEPSTALVSTYRGRCQSWDLQDSKICDQETVETPGALPIFFWDPS